MNSITSTCRENGSALEMYFPWARLAVFWLMVFAPLFAAHSQEVDGAAASHLESATSDTQPADSAPQIGDVARPSLDKSRLDKPNSDTPSGAETNTGGTSNASDNPIKSPDELRLSVRRLVRQLDDRQLATRNRAEAELIELGDAVLPLLPANGDASSEEVRHRLTRVRQQILLSRSKRFVETSTVTLEGKAIPLADVLSAFEKQTGNRFDDQSGMTNDGFTPKVDANFNQTPFWEALDNVLDQVGMTTYHFSQDQALILQRAEEGARSRRECAQYVGAFRLEPIRVIAQRDLRAADRHQFKLVLEVAWEPRLRPLALRVPLSGVKAEDEKGRSLRVKDPQAVLPVPLNSVVSAVEVEIPLEPPPRGVEEIARVRGAIKALVPGAVESFRFDNLEKARQAKIRKGGVTVVLREARRNNDLWDVRILLRFDAALGALASHQGWFYQNKRQVLDPNGRSIEELAEELTSQTENEIGLVYAYELPQGPAGHTFVYETPTSFLELPLEFDLKDIPLP